MNKLRKEICGINLKMTLEFYGETKHDENKVWTPLYSVKTAGFQLYCHHVLFS